MKIFFLILASILFLHSCSPKQNKEEIANSFKCLKAVMDSTSIDTSSFRKELSRAIELTVLTKDKQHDSLVCIACRKYGGLLSNDSKYREAIFYYQKGLLIGKRHFDMTEEMIFKCYRNIGNNYYQMEDYQNGIINYDSVKIIKTDEASLTMKVEVLRGTAICYQQLKDYDSAENLIKEACLYAESFSTPNVRATLLAIYSTILRSAKNFEPAITTAQKSIYLLEPLIKSGKLTKQDSITLATANFYIAFALKDSGLYLPAVPYYLKAIDIFKNLNSVYSQTTGLMNLANTLRKAKQYNQAESYLKEAIDLLNKQTTLSNVLIVRKGELYAGLDEVSMDRKDYPKALEMQDSAIASLTRYDENISLNNLLLTHRYNLLDVMIHKAEAHFELFLKHQDREGDKTALALTDSIIQLSDDIRADYFSDDAKMNLANDIKPALERAVGFCQKLYDKTKNAAYLHKALSFVEFSRSMVLFENARLSNQLPPALKAENEALKKEEAVLVGKNNVDDLQIYLRHKRQFREKIKSHNKNQVPTLATFQTELLPNDKRTALIEYFVGDSTVSIFVLTKDDLKVFTQPKTADFDTKLNRFRQEFTQTTPLTDATHFTKLSNALYNDLLRGAILTLPPSVDKLIIAPDGALSYIPFEILTPSVSSADFRQNDFLLKHFQISYAYSASLLLEQKRMKKNTAPSVFGGFAPKYADKDTLQKSKLIASRAVLTREGAYELKGAKEEVQAISQLLKGAAFSDDAANEGQFKQTANQYQILHCAMHSLTDDTDPMQSKLLFTLQPQDTLEDGDLTAAELYTLSLKADLAVLSACNTGFGKISRGEGVMSLARAFTYAGVPATVTSLWKVPDLTTREIMVEFYKNLKNGQTKDAALRQAKLTYLENAPESVAANPYFWAGFVPMGNMEAMDLDGNSPLSMVWVLAVLVALILVVWFWRRRKAVKA